MREIKTAMSAPDILVVGGGIIGLSVALELRSRGASVAILERSATSVRTAGMASWAAAGMIAAADPFNPTELRELSGWSESLYDRYLAHVQDASGQEVRYQTAVTRQYLLDGSSYELSEHSLNPRELFAALRQAMRAETRHGIASASVTETPSGIELRASSGEVFRAGKLVWANGAWARPWTEPRKGQMMRLRWQGTVVHRAEHVYVVPRTHGEQAGTALVGATVEDAGFDETVRESDLAALRQAAAKLVPEIHDADLLESWAGFRPASRSGLPLLGPLPGSTRQFVCTGHFRNGILLAPASAVVIADLIEGQAPPVDLSAFSVPDNAQL